MINSHIVKSTSDFTVIRDKNTNCLEFQFHKNSDGDLARCVDVSTKIRLLPSSELKKQAYTPDLENNWKGERLFSEHISIWFIIKVFKIHDEFIEKLIDSQINDRMMATLIEAIAGQYESLRQLIKTGFSILKKYFPNCPATAEDLLFQIIEEERNLPFETKIVHSFLQYEPSKLAQLFNELSKENIDKSKVEKLKPSHVKGDNSTSLSARVLLCLDENLDRTPKNQALKIKHRVNIYNESSRYIDEILATDYCKRTNQGKAIPTVTWNNGEVSYNDAGRNNRKSP